MNEKEAILNHNHFDFNFILFYERYLSTEIKRHSDNDYRTLCPFHDETEPSFSIKKTTGEYYCHGCGEGGDIFQFYGKEKNLNTKRHFPKILRGICKDFNISYEHKPQDHKPVQSKIVKTYDYQDENGKMLFQACRCEPKAFKQRRPNGNGGWIYNLKNVRRVLYRLPEVIKADEVIIVEGEKDADNLTELGFTATTCPMGAGKWSDDYNESLKGKDVILIPDNDDQGREHMAKVGASLNGYAKTLKLLELPNLPDKGDVSDFIELFKSRDEIKEKLPILIDKAEPYKPQSLVDEIRIAEKAKEILNARQPCDTYDLSNLPSMLKDCCQEICESTQAEPIMVAQSFIVTISALIKKKAFIQEGEYFQNLYPVIWAISIADSGDFKSTGIQKGARLAYERERDVQEEIETIENTEKEQISKAHQRSAMLPNRSTAEALLEHLANDQGGMIICTEIGEWLENLEKQHNKGFKALITDLFDVPPYYGYSTKGGGYLAIRRPFISINGVSTLTWIKENTKPGDVNSGFFARFLMFYPPKKSVIPPALPYQIAQRDFRPLDKVRQIISGLPESINFKLSQQGREYFEAVHTELYKTVRKENEATQQILNPYLKRWSPYILKLAMLLQVFIEPHIDRINIDAIESAKSIVDYAIKSTTHLFQNQLGESAHQAKERRVIEYIASQGGKVTRSQLQQSHILDGGTDDYDYVCKSLDDAGKLKIDSEPSKKKDWEYTLSD